MLGADEDRFAQNAVVKFCPNAISPSAMSTEEDDAGFLLVREDGLCGAQTTFLSHQATTPSDCAALAAEAGATAFSYGKMFAEGVCFAQDLAVDETVFSEFKANRA